MCAILNGLPNSCKENSCHEVYSNVWLLLQEEHYGRARVHTQWGDDQDDIKEAVDMCPVDCINYVSPVIQPIATHPTPGLCQIVTLCEVYHVDMLQVL